MGFMCESRQDKSFENYALNSYLKNAITPDNISFEYRILDRNVFSLPQRSMAIILPGSTDEWT